MSEKGSLDEIRSRLSEENRKVRDSDLNNFYKWQTVFDCSYEKLIQKVQNCDERPLLQQIHTTAKVLAWACNHESSVSSNRATTDTIREDTLQILEEIKRSKNLLENANFVSPDETFTNLDNQIDALTQTEEIKTENQGTNTPTPTMSTEVFKPPNCNDFTDLERYIKKMEMYFDCIGKTDGVEQCKSFKFHIASSDEWFPTVESIATTGMTFSTLKEKLLTNLNPSSLMKNATLIGELVDIRQLDPSISGLEEFYKNFVKVASKIDKTKLADDCKVGLFVRGLTNPGNVAAALQETDTLPEVFVRAKKACQHTEQIQNFRFTSRPNNNRQNHRPMNSQRLNNASYRPKNASNANHNVSNATNASNHRHGNRRNSKYCKLCRKFGHYTNDCFSTKHREKVNQMEEMIANLKAMGQERQREIEEYEKRGYSDVEEGQFDEELSGQDVDTDLWLGSQNVEKINNSILNLNAFISNNLSPANTQLASVSFPLAFNDYFERRYSIDNVSGWLDSGATRSCLDHQYTLQENIPITTKPDIPVQSFDGSMSSKIVGFCDIEVNVKGRIVKLQPLVVKNLTNNLFGMDLIRKCPGRFVEKNGKMKFEFDSPSREVKIYASKKIVLPALSSRKIPIKSLVSESKWPNDEVLVAQNPKQTTLHCPNMVMSVTSDSILLVNPTTNDYTVKEGQKVAIASECQRITDQKSTPTNAFTPENAKKTPKHNPDRISESEFTKLVDQLIRLSDTSEQEKMELRRVLIKNQEVFDVRSPTEIGTFTGPEVDLNPENKEISVPPQKRRIFNPQVWRRANPEIESFRRNDVIETCPFPAVPPANIVLVVKPGCDKPRVCIDYKAINKLLPDCHFITESFDSLIMKIGSFEVMTNLDLKSCYHAYTLTKKSRPYTAFYGENEVFQFKRMPFGIKPAAAWAQKLLSSVILEKNFRLQLGSASMISLFLDDILITSQRKDHAADLDKVLSRLKDFGYVVKFKKCNFFKKKLKFLGVNLSAPGKIEIDEEFIEALDRIKMPTTTKGLRGLLGMFNWRSDFLENFNEAAHPLYELLHGTDVKKSEKINLEVRHVNCIQDLIKKAKNAVKLSIPQFGVNAPPYEIEVDASSVGFGACLRQGQNIIAFASKSLSPAGKNYDNCHRELAGVIWALEKFRKFIQFASHKTKVFTDNKVVSYLKNATAAKLIRWRTQIANFNIEILHRKGEDMKVADPLSRLLDVDPNEVEDGGLKELAEEIVIASLNAKNSTSIDASSDASSNASSNASSDASSNASNKPNPDSPNASNENDGVDKIAESAKILGMHFEYGHCSAQRLKNLLPGIGSEDAIRKVIKNCPVCLKTTPVKTYRQMPGTIFPENESPGKNKCWYIDFVFPKTKTGKKTTVLTILDRDTDFLIAKDLLGKKQVPAAAYFRKLFAITGVPIKICADREFDSVQFKQLAKEFDFELALLPRNSPHANLVERKHRCLKEFWVKNPNLPLEKIVKLVNEMKRVSDIESKLSPNELFVNNNVEGIKNLRKIRLIQSEKRGEKVKELRNRNIMMYDRQFRIGDLVRYSSLDNKLNIRFGEVEKVNSKFVSVKEFGSGKDFQIHAKDLEKIDETFRGILDKWI